MVDVGSKDRLTEISLSGGMKHGRVIALYDDAALAHIWIGWLQRLEKLDITGNANLEQIDVGSLRTVDLLQVTNNPKLDAAQLGTVRTFSSTVSSNAASP